MDFKKWFESEWTSFKPGRQREFPVMYKPGMLRKATSFVDPDMVDPEEEAFEDVDFNLYHVTTNLSGVKKSGRLKSRSQLGVIGLGGGPADVVSTTYDYSKARNLYSDMQFITELVAGKVRASLVWSVLTEQLTDYEIEELLPVPLYYLQTKEDRRKFIDGNEEILDRHLMKPKDIYEFYQELEEAVVNIEGERELAGDPHFQSVPGFLGGFEQMKQINPANIAIIQVVARKGAQSETIPEEKELRFKPDDLRIIRYFQP